MQMIHSKLHEALLTLNTGFEQKRAGTQGSPAVDVRWLFDELIKEPLYVLDGALVDNIKHDDLTRTMSALFEAGLMRLPFPRMGVELWSDTSEGRLFLLIEEQATPGNFKVGFVQWFRTKDNMGLSLAVLCDYQWSTKLPKPLEGQSAEMYWHDEELEGNGHGWLLKFMTGDRVIDDAPEPTKEMSRLLRNVCMGIMLAVTMTNIGGIEREVIDPVKLNKHRIANGKGKIHTHTIVRLGHVYDKSGRRVAYSRGSSGGDRKPTVVHMRAAHTRRQHHGPDFLESDEGKRYRGLPSTTETHHVVLIDAVLVNYRDGTDLAQPLPKLVKF